MKFSDISQEDWAGLSPYLDTCLLPVTGMTGSEAPHEATVCLEKLRDAMDMIEIPFKGRVVTYPACHYIMEGTDAGSFLAAWCGRMRRAGFKHIVMVTASANPDLTCPEADLFVRPGADGQLPESREVSRLIQEMWSGQAVSRASGPE